jgi:hypothetical protein
LSEDGEGIALVPAEIFEERMKAVVERSAVKKDE